MQNELFSQKSNGRDLTFTLNTRRLDISNSDEIKLGMLSAVEGSEGTVTVDLCNVEFIDSCGLSALVSVRKQMRDDREMSLKNTNEFVTKVVKMTKLDQVFKI